MEVRLLYSYPHEFRINFADDMVQVFQDQGRLLLRQQGWLGGVWLWAWAISDLLMTVPPEHLANLKGTQTIMLKRLFDILFSVTLLVLLWPLFVVLAVLIILDSGRPIFYIQERIGRHGQAFRMPKFRTMVVNAGQISDPAARITRMGGLLRRTSLDELPQLFSVLRGQMSLVGPRPAQCDNVDLSDTTWQQVLAVRPGLTGLSQIFQLSSSDQRAKLDLDINYIRTHSLLMDLGILWQTIRRLVMRK